MEDQIALGAVRRLSVDIANLTGQLAIMQSGVEYVQQVARQVMPDTWDKVMGDDDSGHPELPDHAQGRSGRLGDAVTRCARHPELVSRRAMPSGYGSHSTASRRPMAEFAITSAVVREPVAVHGRAPGRHHCCRRECCELPPRPGRGARRVRRPSGPTSLTTSPCGARTATCSSASTTRTVSPRRWLWSTATRFARRQRLFRSLSEDVREANKRWQDEMECQGLRLRLRDRGAVAVTIRPLRDETRHPRARRLPAGRGRGAQEVPHRHHRTRP